MPPKRFLPAHIPRLSATKSFPIGDQLVPSNSSASSRPCEEDDIDGFIFYSASCVADFQNASKSAKQGKKQQSIPSAPLQVSGSDADDIVNLDNTDQNLKNESGSHSTPARSHVRATSTVNVIPRLSKSSRLMKPLKKSSSSSLNKLHKASVAPSKSLASLTSHKTSKKYKIRSIQKKPESTAVDELDVEIPCEIPLPTNKQSDSVLIASDDSNPARSKSNSLNNSTSKNKVSSEPLLGSVQLTVTPHSVPTTPKVREGDGYLSEHESDDNILEASPSSAAIPIETKSKPKPSLSANESAPRPRVKQDAHVAKISSVSDKKAQRVPKHRAKLSTGTNSSSLTSCRFNSRGLSHPLLHRSRSCAHIRIAWQIFFDNLQNTKIRMHHLGMNVRPTQGPAKPISPSLSRVPLEADGLNSQVEGPRGHPTPTHVRGTNTKAASRPPVSSQPIIQRQPGPHDPASGDPVHRLALSTAHRSKGAPSQRTPTPTQLPPQQSQPQLPQHFQSHPQQTLNGAHSSPLLANGLPPRPMDHHSNLAQTQYMDRRYRSGLYATYPPGYAGLGYPAQMGQPAFIPQYHPLFGPMAPSYPQTTYMSSMPNSAPTYSMPQPFTTMRPGSEISNPIGLAHNPSQLGNPSHSFSSSPVANRPMLPYQLSAGPSEQSSVLKGAGDGVDSFKPAIPMSN